MNPVFDGVFFGLAAALAQAQSTQSAIFGDLSGLLTTGGTIGVLVWFLKYATARWEKLDERHEALHQVTLKVVQNSSEAIAENTMALKQLKGEIRFCQLVRSGQLEFVNDVVKGETERQVENIRRSLHVDDTPYTKV